MGGNRHQGAGDWGTLADRTSADRTMADHTRGPATAPQPAPTAPVVRHVWINAPDHRHAGLHIGWRRLGPYWQGRIVHLVLHEDTWLPVEEWIDAGLIELA